MSSSGILKDILADLQWKAMKVRHPATMRRLTCDWESASRGVDRGNTQQRLNGEEKLRTRRECLRSGSLWNEEAWSKNVTRISTKECGQEVRDPDCESGREAAVMLKHRVRLYSTFGNMNVPFCFPSPPPLQGSNISLGLEKSNKASNRKIRSLVCTVNHHW